MSREKNYLDYLSEQIPQASNEFFNKVELEFIKLKQRVSICSLKCFNDVEHLKYILKDPNLEAINLRQSLACAKLCQKSIENCELYTKNRIQQLENLHKECLEKEDEFSEVQLIKCFEERYCF